MTIQRLDPIPPKFSPLQIDIDFHDWQKTIKGVPKLFGQFFCERHQIINPYLTCVIAPGVAINYIRHYYREGARPPAAAPVVERRRCCVGDLPKEEMIPLKVVAI